MSTTYSNTFSGSNSGGTFTGTVSLNVGIDGFGDVSGTGTLTLSFIETFDPRDFPNFSGVESGRVSGQLLSPVPAGSYEVIQYGYFSWGPGGFEGNFNNNQTAIVGSISIVYAPTDNVMAVPLTLYGQPPLPPIISFDSGSSRVDASAGVATYTLSRSSVPLGDLGSSVTISTSDGVAVAGRDYSAVTNTLVVFGAGQTSVTFTVPIFQDNADAAAHINPDFEVTLSNPTNASIGFGTADTTIVEDLGVSAASAIASYMAGQLAKPAVISDSAQNVGAALDGLQGLAAAGKLGSINFTDAGTPTLSVNAAQVATDTTALGTISGGYRLHVSDSAFNVGSHLDALQRFAASGLSESVTCTDPGTPTLSLSAGQVTADATALGDISGNYTVAVADTAADVIANLPGLQSLVTSGKLSSITLTDSSPSLSLTATQVAQDAAALHAITGNFALTVTGGVSASVDSFLAKEDVTGRGLNGINADFSGQAPSGGNSAIGFQNATFTNGYNAVVLDGSRSNYAIQVNAGGVTTIKDIGVGDTTYGQTVTVSGESYIIFNGASSTTISSLPVYSSIYFIDNPANAQLVQFFSAATQFKSSIALSGLEYWQTQLASGLSLNAIAQSFLNTSYFQSTYGSPGTTDAQHVAYIQALYQNILGMNLSATNAGVEYWATQMDNGTLTGATTLISFSNATASTSLINAVSGSAAGSGAGWLIAPSLTGGYADPGEQMSAATVLSQGAAGNFYNISLVDPGSVSSSGATSGGISLTPGTITIGSSASGSTIYMSSSFNTLVANNSGDSIHDGPGADTITVKGAGNVLTLGNATTDYLNLGNATGTYIFGYTPARGSVLAVSAMVNSTTATLLDGTTTAVAGNSLNFGTFSSSSPIFVNIGNVGGDTVAEVVAAANKAYLVADINGNATTGALGEHVVFLGTDSGGNADIWAFQAPLSTVTVNGQTVQVPYGGADTSGSHSVTSTEISLVATLIGVSATSLTKADLTATAVQLPFVAPTYTFSHDAQVSVTEGATETFSLSTTNLAGATFYYTLTGVTAAQVVGGHLTGTITVGSTGTATLPITLTGTAGQGLSGSLTASISTTAGGAAVASASVALTETTTATTYALSHDTQASITEGGTETFTLTTTGVAANTVLDYTLTGVTAAEVVGGQLTGTITVGSTGGATLPITLTGTAGQGLSGSLTASISTTAGGVAVASGSVALTETTAAFGLITPTDLGQDAQASAINNAGQIVGIGSAFTATAANHAYLLQTGSMIDLGTLGGAFSGANAVNSAGQVVGWSMLTSNNGVEHAALWQNGTITDLGTLGGSASNWSVANAINSQGQVVGYSYGPSGSYHAFLWQNGTMTDLGSLAGSSGTSSATGISAAGQVVGNTSTGTATHAFMWQPPASAGAAGTMLDIGTLAGYSYSSYATGVSATGYVVGVSYNASGGGAAFLWGGSMTNLGTLGGSLSYATAINSTNQVVGYAFTSGNVAQHAFVWQSGKMTDLNSLLTAGSGWVLSEAEGINDSGQIVGIGTHNGVAAAFEVSLSSLAGHMTVVGVSAMPEMAG